MISDKERREVARKLRAIPHVDCFGHDSINPTDLWRTIGFLRTVDGRIPTEEVRYLADLIDRPTCRNVYDESEMGSCKNGFKCSECKNIVEDYEGYCISGEFYYCPKCGREVVE